MTRPGLPAHGEIVGFAARVLRGELSERERADVAALVVLLGGPVRTGEAIGSRHGGDQALQDEFVVCMWQMASELVVSTLAEARR